MLKKLFIQNYAIIDEIEIDFSGQMNVITGETGAGKSILMGALSLILGERADSSVLVNKDKKCFIEGLFSIDRKPLVIDFLQKNEWDIEEDLVLRREIAANGKSRAFINDSPATLQQLKALASLLVDLHQQFDTLELGDSDFQREVLDALAGNSKTIHAYRETYYLWQQTSKELAALQEQKAAFNKEFDYHQFLFNELNELGLKENELENLDHELSLLSNAEGIKTALSKAYFELKETEQPMVLQLKQLLNQLQAFADFHPSLSGIIERIKTAHIELQDIAEEIDHLNNTVNYDEKRIEFINQRLMEGYKLTKKHGLQNTAQLIELRNSLELKLNAVLDMDDRMIAAEKKLGELLQEATQKAKIISAARKKEAKPFETKVNMLLSQVGMPNASIRVAINESSLQSFGIDQIDFLFDANKSNRFEPIRKVASGGELSRLMLCIKSLVAQSIDLPTLIFDEIDTGISGEAARQVGMIMKTLSASRQLICITHQPQIAGKANAHFLVYKEIKNDAVKTNIRLLSPDERITSIAKMLSGEKPTAAALENAREMMN
ncbi:MAG: repair protein RecN [Bacteroidota bacterium]|jgi:DNA repair protein RecN (Recombination protein N)